MGYTHYFRMHEDGAEFSEQEWLAIQRDFRRVAQAADVKICYEFNMPHQLPLIGDDFIQFNGPGDAGHETMVLARQPIKAFNFCKTNQKPYDLLVMALLIIVFQHTQRLQITSDGTTDEWQPAVDLVERALKQMEVYLPSSIEAPVERPQPRPEQL